MASKNGAAQKVNPWGVKADNSKGDGDYEKPPEGNHVCVLVGLIDLGTHVKDFKGKVREDRLIQLIWELVDETKEDGSPHVMGGTYNFFPDMSKVSKLRLLLEDWRGKKYNDGEGTQLDKLLGQACMLNIGENDKGYMAILSVAQVPKRTQVSKPRLKLYHWSFAYDEPPDIPAWTPFVFGQSTLETIHESREWLGNSASAPEEKPKARRTEKATVPAKQEQAYERPEDGDEEDDVDAPF